VKAKRTQGQKVINLPVSEQFLQVIDESIRACNCRDRASFIREAIFEKLLANGIVNQEEENTYVMPPSRTGKGGPKKPNSGADPAQKAVLEHVNHNAFLKSGSKKEPAK
jgi:hypothetical protein